MANLISSAPAQVVPGTVFSILNPTGTALISKLREVEPVPRRITTYRATLHHNRFGVSGPDYAILGIVKFLVGGNTEPPLGQLLEILRKQCFDAVFDWDMNTVLEPPHIYLIWELDQFETGSCFQCSQWPIPIFKELLRVNRPSPPSQSTPNGVCLGNALQTITICYRCAEVERRR